MKPNANDKTKVSEKSETDKTVMAIKVNPIVWRQFRLYCVANNITCYEQLNAIIKNFLKEKDFYVKIEGNQDATRQVD